MRRLMTEQCTTLLWQTRMSMIRLPLFGMRQSDVSGTWSQSLCDTHHMLTVNLRCGSHVIHLAAKHFLAAINPKPRRGRQAMADHDDSTDTDMDSDAEHDASEEDPSWEPGDLLGKALAFVTQVRRLDVFPNTQPTIFHRCDFLRKPGPFLPSVVKRLASSRSNS